MARTRDAFFVDLRATERRASAATKLYLSGRKPSWNKAVIRRDPASYRGQSRPLTRCSNQFCREYPPEGSRAAGCCLVCQTPL
jgi:hypothetical protein